MRIALRNGDDLLKLGFRTIAVAEMNLHFGTAIKRRVRHLCLQLSQQFGVRTLVIKLQHEPLFRPFNIDKILQKCVTCAFYLLTFHQRDKPAFISFSRSRATITERNAQPNKIKKSELAIIVGIKRNSIKALIGISVNEINEKN